MIRLPTIGVQFGKLPHHSKSCARIDYGTMLTQAQFFLPRYKLLESLAAARSRSRARRNKVSDISKVVFVVLMDRSQSSVDRCYYHP